CFAGNDNGPNVLTRLAPEPRRTSPRIPLGGMRPSFGHRDYACCQASLTQRACRASRTDRQHTGNYRFLLIMISVMPFPDRPVALANQSRSAIRTDSPRNRSDSNFLVISSNFPYAGS